MCTVVIKIDIDVTYRKVVTPLFSYLIVLIIHSLFFFLDQLRLRLVNLNSTSMNAKNPRVGTAS